MTPEPETVALTDIARKPEGAVVRSGDEATRRTEADAPHGVASPSLEYPPSLSDTLEVSTKPPLANGRSSPPLNKNGGNSRLKFCWQHIHGILVIVTLLGLSIGIIVTGYLFSKSAQAKNDMDRRGQTLNISASQFFPDTEQAHNVSLEGTMSLNDFTPVTGLMSTMTINNVSFSSGTPEARYIFCFYLSNDPTESNVTSGFQTHSPLGSSASVARATSDPIGQSLRYPFDTYTSTIDILAIYQVLDPNSRPRYPCRNYVNWTTAPDCSLTVQQSLEGWHASVLLNQSSPILQITVKRDGVIIGLACLLFAVAWLLSLAVCFITMFVIWHRNEPRFDLVATCATLLFALPQLRNAEPGIPATPVLFDAIGYLWNIAIVGLSMLSLILYFVASLLKVKNAKETEKSDPERESLLDNREENV
ncbi:hypothetical protein MSAN_00488000 [Mycena sanguinolenta]|uniref:Transmembrane protein n=1 Tax=Mycena sanguinolenta TaxID=230812 RepID=A0A8H7DFU6_9AGAR|nr:hypothetical protein MSAN_00488000 [Mycena sanguinolenta]